MKNVGLYFGSFNPPHVGHTSIALAALEHFNLDEIWFVVSPQNPFKSNDALAPEHMRLAMTELACASDPRLHTCSVEFDLPRPSYTCDTLRVLQAQYDHRFCLIIGEDNWRVFNQWKDYTWILEHFKVLVYGRQSEGEGLSPTGASASIIPGEYLNISATLVRNNIRRGLTIHSLVDERVEEYLISTGLYH